MDGVEFNLAGMQIRIDSYTEGRRKYVRSQGGKILKVIPYKKSVKISGAEFHSTGVDYQIGQETLYERTNFVSCKGAIFHIKTLDFENPDKSGSAQSIGKTFECAN